MNTSALPSEYRCVYNTLASRLALAKLDAPLTFTPSEKMSVSCVGGRYNIACNKKNRFARLLGILAENIDKGDFEITESASFETLSCMIDLSFGAPLTVESLKEYFETLALFGYNQVLMYLEDMYEIPERPYFGYLRGRYTDSELRELDDYAYGLGIELVACMQTLGHLSAYLAWQEAAALRENNAVLLPDSDKTYEFIEQMLKASTSPFRSKRVHIGCDESHGVGMGNYLKTHGLTPQIDVLITHVNRVADICKKLGLRPMIWHDMIFALCSESYSNYDRMVDLSVIGERLDPSIEIVMWHYGQVPGCEEFMVDKFRAIGKSPMVAGNAHIWKAPLPDNYLSSKISEITLDICKRKGVKEVCNTVWAYSSTMYQLAYLDLCRYGELSYRDNTDELKSRFEFLTAQSYDAIMRMSDLSSLYDTPEAIANASYSNNSHFARYMNSDIAINVIAKEMTEHPRTDYYRAAADFLKPYLEKSSGGRWEFIYGFAYGIFDMLALKCEIVEKLTSAYKSSDREVLASIRDSLLPRYVDSIDSVAAYHAYHKDFYLKPFGAESRDYFYGGRKERAKTLSRRIGLYLDGAITKLEELESEYLDYTSGPISPIRV